MHDAGKFWPASLCNLDQLHPAGALVITEDISNFEATSRGTGSAARSSYRQAHGVFVGVDEVWLPLSRENGGVGGDPRPAKGTPIGAIQDVESLSGALAPILSTKRELMGEAATRTEILKQLENAVQEARYGDLVIAYFRGYAERKYDDLYLIPHDFKPGSFLSTAVSFRLVSAVLSSAPDVRGLIILDAGHAAAVGFDMSTYRVGSELGLMVSSGPQERAYASVQEDEKLHGDFTWDLVTVLNEKNPSENKDPWSFLLIDWFDEAYGLTDKRDRQHPVMLGTMSPNLELRSRRRDDEGPEDRTS